MDLREVGWGSKEWIELAQNRDSWQCLVNAVMSHRVSKNAGNFLSNWGPVNFSGRPLLLGVSKQASIRHYVTSRTSLTNWDCRVTKGQLFTLRDSDCNSVETKDILGKRTQRVINYIFARMKNAMSYWYLPLPAAYDCWKWDHCNGLQSVTLVAVELSAAHPFARCHVGQHRNTATESTTRGLSVGGLALTTFHIAETSFLLGRAKVTPMFSYSLTNQSCT